MQDPAATSQVVPAQGIGASAGGANGLFGQVLAFAAGGVVLKAVAVILQVACIVHVIRRREDYWWIFLLVFVPLVGSLVYFVVVVWPDLRQRGRFRRRGSPYGGSGRRRIRQLERQVALSDTVAHRSELAAAYCEAGQFVLARQGYEGCIQGLYAKDAHLLFGLATARFGEGEFQLCLDSIARVDRQDIPEHVNQMDFLRAKALLALGRDDEAAAALRAVAPRAPTLEAWWRLAELQARQGDAAAADQACRRLLEESARLGSAARKRNREWTALAKHRLKAQA